MKKLWKVTIRGTDKPRNYYVVAETPNDAQTVINQRLGGIYKEPCLFILKYKCMAGMRNDDLFST